MILNIRHNGLRRFYERGERQRVPPEYADKIHRILLALDSGAPLERLNRTGYRLHRLTGNFDGYWAVAVSANWRIIFRPDNADAGNVGILYIGGRFVL